MSGKKQTIQKCLETIGVGSDIFSDCNNVQEEFSKIKKAYFRKVLVAHPDKGGDPELFRAVQTSFEVLRDLFDSARVDSFATSAEQSTAEAYNGAYEDFGQMPTPSWEYYYSAAEEAVPTYRVELAKSGRSACKQKGKAKKCFGEAPENPPYIAKDEIRIGSIEQESGSYSRWVHLGCWRVPSKVWLGLPDSNPDPATCLCRDPAQFESALLSMNEVLLCGLRDLSKSDRDKVVRHVMDKNNWAKFVNRKPPSESVYSKVAGASKVGRASDSLMTGQASTDIVQQGFHAPRSHFILPVPGRDGAKANSLAGKTVVCTGVFPELGGGTGLNLGKDKLKALVTAFGGRVTGSVSGKTDILIVGKDPGYSKVSVARAKSVQLMSLKDLTGGLTGGFAIEDSRPMQIASFSSGYGANSQAYLASSDDLAVAQGKREPTPLIESSLKKGKSQKKTTSGKSINTKQIKAEAIADIITCDGCGVDCSEQSWFVETTQSDFCAACKPSLGYTPQRYGVDIVDTTKSDHDSTIVIAASGPVNKKQRKV